MAATLAQRAVIAGCSRHGLGPVESLRLLLPEVELVQTPADLRRTLARIRGPARTLGEALLDVMPRSGAETYADHHLWFHGGDGRRGRDWIASPVVEPGTEAFLVEFQQAPGDLIADEDLLKRFEKEHRVMQDITHPHVMSCVSAGIAPGGAPYRVTPLREGPTLRRVLDRRGILPLDEVVGVAVQVALGLEAIHTVGLAHRDLDAHVVGCTSSGTLQVLDVGRSGDRPLTIPPVVSPLTPRGGLDWADQGPSGGTRQWRKFDRTRLELWLLPPNPPVPEVLAGALPDARSDIYHLGVLLTQALLGPADAPAQALDARPDLDHGVVRLFKACLDPDPGKRPSAAEVVVYAESVQEAQRQSMTRGNVRPG